MVYTPIEALRIIEGGIALMEAQATILLLAVVGALFIDLPRCISAVRTGRRLRGKAATFHAARGSDSSSRSD